MERQDVVDAVTKQVIIPSRARGLVIGARGTTMKSMQAVACVHLSGQRPGDRRDSVLTISGTAEAVRTIESQVLQMLGQGKSRSAFLQQLHLDLAGIPAVQLTKVSDLPRELPVDVGEYVAKRSGFFALCEASRDMELAESPGLGSGGGGGGGGGDGLHSVHFPWSLDAVCAGFGDFLRGLRALPSTAEVQVCTRFGMTLFHSGNVKKLVWPRPAADFARKGERDYSTLFASRLRATPEGLEAALAQEGFKFGERRRSTHVQVRDAGMSYEAEFAEPDAGQEDEHPGTSAEGRLHLRTLVKLSTSPDSQLEASVVRPEAVLAYQMKLTTSEDVVEGAREHSLRAFLEGAWSRKEITMEEVLGSELEREGAPSIVVARHVDVLRLSDGLHCASLEIARSVRPACTQKDASFGGCYDKCPEVELHSYRLDQALEHFRQTPGASEARPLELFRELLVRTDELSGCLGRCDGIA